MAKEKEFSATKRTLIPGLLLGKAYTQTVIIDSNGKAILDFKEVT